MSVWDDVVTSRVFHFLFLRHLTRCTLSDGQHYNDNNTNSNDYGLYVIIMSAILQRSTRVNFNKKTKVKPTKETI